VDQAFVNNSTAALLLASGRGSHQGKRGHAHVASGVRFEVTRR
jgi:hypothetical protein